MIKLKIAFICTEKLPVPPISGGAIQLYIEGILPEISRHHEVTVFCIQNEALPDEEETGGVRYVRVAGRDKTEYIRNVEQKLGDSFDLVHVFNRPRWVVRLSDKYPKTRFSLSLHNEMIHEKKIPRDMALECVNKVEFIATVSRFIADGLLGLFPEAAEKVFTVYSGADVSRYSPAASEEGAKNKEILKKKLGLADKKVVLFVGRLSEKKGVDKLISAMKSVMEVRSDVALVVVGSKWYGANTADEYSKLVKAQAADLRGPVIFTGYLPYAQIPAYYNLGDIFVCPSQWNEPLARVHFEAMAAGLPIITTNRGGNKEVFEGCESGIVIDDYANPAAFAEQILFLLDHPEIASEMGMKARRMAEEKYSWARVADDLLQLFKKVEDTVASERAAPEAISAVSAETAEAPEQDQPEEPAQTSGTQKRSLAEGLPVAPIRVNKATKEAKVEKAEVKLKVKAEKEAAETPSSEIHANQEAACG
ncbi:MAG: glycosyltransferase family 4 protein, partial [Clostridiales bacterium]|nr:glycosyltransferase family 4 protein [Clostridiales bacterium]